MTEISPLLATRLNNTNKILKPQLQSSQPIQSTIDSTTKPDSVELSTKTFDKKKLIKYGAIGVAFLGLAAGVATLIKRGQVPSEILSAQKSANKMEEDAKILASEAQKIVDEEIKPLQESAQKLADEVKDHAAKIKNEVVELFNNGGKNKEGIQVASITKLEDSPVMEEFDSKGHILRISQFTKDGFLDSFEEITPNGKNIYKMNDDGGLKIYSKNIKNLPDGSTTADELLGLSRGELCYYEVHPVTAHGRTIAYESALRFDPFDSEVVYRTGFKIQDNGMRKFSMEIELFNDKLFSYAKDIESIGKFDDKYTHYLIFDSKGNCESYCKDYKILSDGTQESLSLVSFKKDGSLSTYEKNAVRKRNQDESSDIRVLFKDNKPIVCMKSYKNKDGIEKAAKTLIKEGSKWVEK